MGYYKKMGLILNGPKLAFPKPKVPNPSKILTFGKPNHQGTLIWKP